MQRFLNILNYFILVILYGIGVYENFRFAKIYINDGKLRYIYVFVVCVFYLYSSLSKSGKLVIPSRSSLVFRFLQFFIIIAQIARYGIHPADNAFGISIASLAYGDFFIALFLIFVIEALIDMIHKIEKK